MTKDNVQNIIEKLVGDNPCSEYCQGCVCENEILVGDVLEKINKQDIDPLLIFAQYIDLLKYWQPCGFTRSLQDIIISYGDRCGKDAECSCPNEPTPEAQALFEFLNGLI